MRKIAGNPVGNPYPGWRAFREADQDHFCGRDKDRAAVIELWTENRLTVVTGPVASGKTSLLQAGVYPKVKEEQPGALPPAQLTHGMTFPFAVLPEHNPYTYALLRAWSPTEVPIRLAGRTVSEFLRQFGRRHDHTVFAPIDQVEDIAVDASEGLRRTWRRQFLEDLARACDATPRLHLLLVARPEALDTITASLGTGARYEVGPLTVDNGLQAMTEPAMRAGRTFAPGAARQLIDDVRTYRIVTVQGGRTIQADRIEPALLQAVCHHLWRGLQDDRPEISEWEVRESGDVDSALAEYCAEAIAKVAAEHNLKVQRVHSWLLSTFVTDSGVRGMAYEGLTLTGDMPNGVARSLVDWHLLSSEVRSSARWYQLLSDRLIEPLRHANIKLPAPPTADDYLRAAKRQLALGEIDRARELASCVVRLAHGPRNHDGMRTLADAEVLLGNVAHEQDDPSGALPHYSRAISLLDAAGDPGGAVSCLAAVGQTLLALGSVPGQASENRIRDAVDKLRAAVGLAPSALALQTQLALALWQLGEGEAAVAVLNGVLGVDGGNREALRARGEILADIGEATSAKLDLERPSVRDRASALAAHGLAMAELGDYSRATEEIDAARTSAPHDGRVLFYAARASALKGDKVTSWELAQQAVDATNPPLSPSHRDAAIKLAGHE
jgi:tetratricopeptide (TPR) repeat protein